MAILGDRDQPKKPFNKIRHASDWDGTLRSYKAISTIERFHPKNAGDIARIWIEERNVPANMYEVQFPMFLEVPGLVDFVTTNVEEKGKSGINYYITHWDLTDSIADMWRLYPVLKMNYPGRLEMFSGVNIGAGWHDIIEKVRKILHK